MKNIIVGLLFIGALAACSKQNEAAIIIKDCTGSYINQNDKDYLICNDEIVDDFDSGTEVSVSFEKVDNCENENDFVCLMYHENEGVIEITKIRKK